MFIKRYTVLLLSVVVFVTSSILLLIVSISTKYWKYVRITKTNKTSEVILQMSNSGLFHTCYSLNRFEDTTTKLGCSQISLPNIENTSDNNALNAYYITLLSLVFPVLSALTLVVATVACFYGFWSKKRRSSLLFASLFYVTSGLLNVVGLMCYINRTNDELGQINKKEENTVALYFYGWSFYMATVSFGFTEVSAVLCIYFYNELLRIAKQIILESRHASKNDLFSATAGSFVNNANNEANFPHTAIIHHSNSTQNILASNPGNSFEPLLDASSKFSANQFSSLGNYVTGNNVFTDNSYATSAGITSQHPVGVGNNITSLPSRPSSSVAMIPMSSMSAGQFANRNAQESNPTIDCQILPQATSLTNFSPVLLAGENSTANPTANFDTNHVIGFKIPQPIRVQKQSSVSSSASSPPQMQGGANNVGYCNGNIPGATNFPVFATPPHLITPIGGANMPLIATAGGSGGPSATGGAKSFLVNDTTV